MMRSSSVFVSLFLMAMGNVVSISDTSKLLICNDLLALYEKMPKIVTSAMDAPCDNEVGLKSCWLVKAFLLEKSREQVHIIRQKLECFGEDLMMMNIDDSTTVCRALDESPAKATEFIKHFFTVPPMETITQIAAAGMESELAEAFQPIMDMLHCKQ